MAVRYEFAPLEQAAGPAGARELAEMFGVTSRTIFRWKANGIPDLQADRAAIARTSSGPVTYGLVSGYTESSMCVSELVRRCRIDAGLSQQRLAELAGTSQPAISAYEAGTQHPTAATLERLVQACGAQLSVRPEDRRPSVASLVAGFLRDGDFDDEAYVLRWSLNQFARNVWDELTPEERAKALRFAPPWTGSRRWDAFFAALAHYLSVASGVDRPGWVDDGRRTNDRAVWYPGRPNDERAKRRVDRDPAPWFVVRGVGLEMRALPSGVGKHVAATA